MADSQGIEEFFVTFGVQYGRREGDLEHPLGMYSDGYAVIEAPDLHTARKIAHAIFDDKWSFIYDKDDFIHDGTAKRWHPAGELLRIRWTQGAEPDHWEYRPGYLMKDGRVFAQASIIAPGYVRKFLAEGGDVIRRRVGEFETVTTDNAPEEEGSATGKGE
jgi:hypothetical protein